MARILLLGAGFSRNWGGWLTGEVFGDLVGRLKDPALVALLNRASSFEEALAQLQNEYARSASVQAQAQLTEFQTAVTNTFGEMNTAFSKIVDFEFQNHSDLMVRTFLMKFDAIFTLNQDLLLELHYLNDNIMLGSPGRWHGWQMPGIEPIHDPSLNLMFDKVKQRRRVKSDAFTVAAKHQPYFKLHGSTDWQDADGGPLLVIGGNKSGMIRRHQILTWYAEQFAGYLAQPSSKLMVIGYSFTDEHINRAIHNASQRSQLQMFIVDPNGREAIRKANPTFGASIYAPQPIEEVAIVGESLRPLNTTFGGKDPLEHGKLLRFFQ